MGSLVEFWKNALVVWIQTLRKDQPLKTLAEFADGVFLSQVMVDIDPVVFSSLQGQTVVNSKDLNVKVQNLAEVMRNVKRFYQESLHQLLVMKMPDLLAIVKDPESEYGLQELKKVLLLVLGCAIQCEKKQYFIEKIRDLDVNVQTGLVSYIQEITENSNNVLPYRLQEFADVQHEQLLEISETMYYQIQKLVEERDEYVEATLDLNLEKEETGTQGPSGPTGRTPPLSPTGSIRSSILQANKQRLRDLQNELEERNLTLGELKEELAGLKESLENLKQENKALQTEARWAKSYRDEIDILKSQLDHMNKVEGENAKYKDKVRELDFYKTRVEQLKEQYDLLYETKMVLEEQLASSGVRVERAGHLDDENEKLIAQIRQLTEQREVDQERIRELLDETVKLNMDKQASHREIAVLTAELESFRTQNSIGHSIPLAAEYNASTSTELLRLDKENKRLMKLVDSLRDNTPRSRELERENLSLTSSINEHKRTISKLTQELTHERKKVYKLAEMSNIKADELSNLELNLDTSFKEKTNLLNDLARKEADIEALQQAMVESQQYATGNGLSDRKTEERLMVLKQDIAQKENELKGLQSELKRERENGEKLDAEVSRKEEEVDRLEAKVKECETFNAKVEQQLKQREKEIAALERRFESAVTENKSLSQSVSLKEDKISALEGRVAHLLDSASQDTRKVNKTLEVKLNLIRELETRLAEVQEQLSEQEKLKALLKQKEDKATALSAAMQDLEGKFHDLELRHEKANSTCLQLEHSIKLKDERIKSLEKSLSEIGSSSTLQQNDRIAFLSKSLSLREQELRELEARNAEVLAVNAKIKNSNRQKDDRIQALEDSIGELEASTKPVNDGKVQQIQQKLKMKGEEMMHLEERLEDAMGQINKLQRTVDIKEEKIQQLERSFQELEDSAGQAQKLGAFLEEKTKKVIELEEKVDELTIENKKLVAKVTQKEERYNSLEKTLHELENAASDKSSLTKMLKTKESKIQALQKQLDEKEEWLVEKDTLIEESQGRSKKLMHALKLREEKLHSLESKMEQLEELKSVSTKLGNLLRLKDDRIKELEERTDELSDVSRQHERLKEGAKQKDDKILSLQERLEDLEEAVKINERLNQQVHQKEEKISTLQLRIRGLEDSLHKTEQLKDAITKSAEDQIQELNRKVDELMDVKVKRQQSIRRREEKIMSLESRLEEVAGEKEHKMNQIQELQSRLEGTMSKFRKLDLSNEEKDEKIQELEARVNELQATYKEHRKLVQQSKMRESSLIRMEARLEEMDSSNKRLTSSLSENETNITSLKQRLEETLGLNNRLNQSIKKQEEKIKRLEGQVLEHEERNEAFSKEKELADKLLGKDRKRLEEFESALRSSEREVAALEKRLSDMKVSEENEKNKAADLLRERNSRIHELEERIRLMEAKSKTELVLVRNRKDNGDKVILEKRIDELTSENSRTKLALQEKSGMISDLEKRMEELQLSATDSDKLNKIVKEKNSQITILRENVERYHEEMIELQTKCDSLRNESSRTQVSLRQKDDRIQVLKSQLEENLSKVHRLSNDISVRDEKIKSLENSFAESSAKEMELREELNQMEAQLDELRQKLGTHVTEKIQFTKRARTELYISRAATVNQHVLTVADVGRRGSRELIEPSGVPKEEYMLLEQERTRLLQQNETLSSRNASLQTENETLQSELETFRNDYTCVVTERDEAREMYRDVDVAAAKIANRCEVLFKLNATLEEENKTLMDQINKLLKQNQHLLFKSLESRDQFLEEERAFSDRVYYLEREKERLTEQVDAANKALEGTQAKKKNLLWRGANKVLKKAGLKKKREDMKDPNTGLPRLVASPEGESKSENSDSSFSPNQVPYRRAPSRDDNIRSLSPEFAPIRAALSQSRLDLQNLGNDHGSYHSPSSGSEQSGPTSRMRPKSEFLSPTEFDTPLRRPKSMEVLDALRIDSEAFTSDPDPNTKKFARYSMVDPPRFQEILRKDSVNSNSSIRSNVSVHSSTSRQSGASSGLQSAASSGLSHSGRMYTTVTTHDFDGVDSRITPTGHVYQKRSGSLTDPAQVSYAEAMFVPPAPGYNSESPASERRSFTYATSAGPSDQQIIAETPRPTGASIFYVPLETQRAASTPPKPSQADRILGRSEESSPAEKQLHRETPAQRSVRVSVSQSEERPVRHAVTTQDGRRRTVSGFSLSPNVELHQQNLPKEGRLSFRGPSPLTRPTPKAEPEPVDIAPPGDNSEPSTEKKAGLWYEYGCV